MAKPALGRGRAGRLQAKFTGICALHDLKKGFRSGATRNLALFFHRHARRQQPAKWITIHRHPTAILFLYTKCTSVVGTSAESRLRYLEPQTPEGPTVPTGGTALSTSKTGSEVVAPSTSSRLTRELMTNGYKNICPQRHRYRWVEPACIQACFSRCLPFTIVHRLHHVAGYDDRMGSNDLKLAAPARPFPAELELGGIPKDGPT